MCRPQKKSWLRSMPNTSKKFDEINNAIIIAVTEGDTELQQELVAEKAALKEEYTTKRGEL